MPARIDRVTLGLAAGLASCIASAQGPSWPNAQDIERALKATPFPSAEQIKMQPVPAPPRITAQPAAIDIEALVRDNARRAIANVGSGSVPTPLRIFITLDMPRASLELLVDQATRAGAVLLLRGLKSHSMRTTLANVSEVIGERQVAWVIDPQAFSRFAIVHAPTFVLSVDRDTSTLESSTCTGSCETPAPFVSVAGDVSLDFALETMLRHRPDIAGRAEPILKRLRAAR